MELRERYSDAEWAALVAAPAAVIAAVIGSSPSNPIAIMQEVGAAVKAFEQAAEQRRHNPLIAALLVALKGRFESYMGRRSDDPAAESIDIIALGRDPAVAVAAVRAATDILAAQGPPDEAAELRAWLIELAEAVAAAAPEGSFLGMGGEQVNERERAMLAELRAALDLSPI
jgi:hypothetical protein